MVEDAVVTEAGSDPTVGYELRQTLELVELMNAADATVTDAVAAVSSQIASAIDAIADRMLAGGRLVYVGAGSSGRIAALDASECEATFSTPAGTVIALVAGGVAAPALVQAAAEDDRPAGEGEILAFGVSATDAVVGVSASGTTPYVLEALAAARVRRHALTVCVVSASESELGALVEHEVAVVTGPEFLAGSTRLKAGTAQKLVLNTISTITMIRLGKTYGNLMVDVAAAARSSRRASGGSSRSRAVPPRGRRRRARGSRWRCSCRDRVAPRRDRRRRGRDRLDESGRSIGSALESAP